MLYTYLNCCVLNNYFQVDYIGGFDTVHIISNNFGMDQPVTLSRNGQIRLEPIYVYN